MSILISDLVRREALSLFWLHISLHLDNALCGMAICNYTITTLLIAFSAHVPVFQKDCSWLSNKTELGHALIDKRMRICVEPVHNKTVRRKHKRQIVSRETGKVRSRSNVITERRKKGAEDQN